MLLWVEIKCPNCPTSHNHSRTEDATSMEDVCPSRPATVPKKKIRLIRRLQSVHFADNDSPI